MYNLSDENYSKSVDAQTYLLHYDWEYYFDEYHNIHIELEKGYYKDQVELLYEHFSINIPLLFDKENIEVILILNYLH